MSLLAWIVVIFAAHALLYYSLGTANWIGTALLATAVWAAVLYGARFFMRQRKKGRT